MNGLALDLHINTLIKSKNYSDQVRGRTLVKKRARLLIPKPVKLTVRGGYKKVKSKKRKSTKKSKKRKSTKKPTRKSRKRKSTKKSKKKKSSK